MWAPAGEEAHPLDPDSDEASASVLKVPTAHPHPPAHTGACLSCACVCQECVWGEGEGRHSLAHRPQPQNLCKGATEVSAVGEIPPIPPSVLHQRAWPPGGGAG